MITRYHLRCPGCDEIFVARLGVEPTRNTRFYLPCPHCELPVKGTMVGTDPHEFKIDMNCQTVGEDHPAVVNAPVVTVNPFVPSSYQADSYSGVGAFATMTLTQILGFDTFLAFEKERHEALDTGQAFWPKIRMLTQYYRNDNVEVFNRIAQRDFGLDRNAATHHERTSVMYWIIDRVTTTLVGETGSTKARVIGRFERKHEAALQKSEDHLLLFRTRGLAAYSLEGDLFTELDRFIENHESWEMGLLGRFMGSTEQGAFGELTLYRDEFSVLRDLYQQGFELSCKCLWTLVAAQNTVKRGHPEDFGTEHPSTVPEKQRASTMNRYDKLPNAHKLAYVTQVPGWESLGELLSSQRRNTIGHATARHDLKSGRVISDQDPDGMTYMEFLSETLGVFEALVTLVQAFRYCRIAASPDFDFGEG